jgi:hypothetical protein
MDSILVCILVKYDKSVRAGFINTTVKLMSMDLEVSTIEDIPVAKVFGGLNDPSIESFGACLRVWDTLTSNAELARNREFPSIYPLDSPIE